MNTNKIGKWSVILGIVIVLNLFFNYTLSLVYHAPEFENFCPATQVVPTVETQAQCVAVGGQWNPNTYGDVTAPKVAGYCDQQFTCRQDYDTARKVYDRNIFIALVILGAITVAVGNFFTTNTVIASGLSLAGVLSFVIASMRYWGSANDWARVFILAVALGLLFWVAVRKFSSKQ